MQDIISNKRELLEFLSELSKQTNEINKSSKLKENTVEAIEFRNVLLREDIELSPYLAKKIKNMLKYFKGSFDFNNKTIIVESDMPFSLFSSVNNSELKNLNIHNVVGSKGMLLTDDITSSIIECVNLTGTIYLPKELGGLVRLSKNTKFIDCSVNLVTKTVDREDAPSSIDYEPIHFGGLAGVSLSGTSFIRCRASGEFAAEARVGGFTALAKDTTFKECTVEGLSVRANRESGLFAGAMYRDNKIVSCKVEDSKISANVYGGLLCGKNGGTLTVENSYAEQFIIANKGTSSYVGGLVGSSDKLITIDSHFKGQVKSNFIVAGICPDAEDTEVIDSTFDIEVTALTYPPMVTHAYETVNMQYMTGSGKVPKFNNKESDINIRVMESGMGGLINPLEEVV